MSIAEFCRTLLVCIDPLIKQTLDTTLSPIRLLEAHPECVCVCVCVHARPRACVFVCMVVPLLRMYRETLKKPQTKYFILAEINAWYFLDPPAYDYFFFS